MSLMHSPPHGGEEAAATEATGQGSLESMTIVALLGPPCEQARE